ncbi:MAG: ketopantoate reductase family protein, partial [Deltaproteobacteria bacterium]
MKIVVVGAGSIGTLLAALLSRSKEEVWLLAKSEETAAKIGGQISVEGVSGSWQARGVKTCGDARQIGTCDLAVICVKAYDTKSAVKCVKPAIGDESFVLTLQNGMGNIELLQDAFGTERVIGGSTNMGATLLEPGKVRHAGKGETTIGRIDGKIPVVMRSIREIFNRSGIETKISKDIKGTLWSKLLINAGINPLTALTRLNNGRLVEFKETKDLMRQAVTEGARLAKRKKIKLIYDDPLAKVEAVCELTSTNVSSMLRDVLRKRRTEVDHINGYIVRQGEELGIPVPVNTVLRDLVKTLEASYEQTVK